MSNRLQQALTSPRLRRRLLVLGLVVGTVWVVFFDSHSLLRRAGYYVEVRTLTEENAALQAEIDWLEDQVGAGLSDELVEKVAREQYGLRRDGETVYPVDHPAD